jgi:hypothetical protein
MIARKTIKGMTKQKKMNKKEKLKSFDMKATFIVVVGEKSRLFSKFFRPPKNTKKNMN